MVSRWNPSAKAAEHFSVNACLAPLASVANMSVTTVEALGSSTSGLDILQVRIPRSSYLFLMRPLSRVQEKFAKANGSQCGFCTPGIVMALYSYLRAYPNATQLEIEENLDGNLCRYVPSFVLAFASACCVHFDRLLDSFWPPIFLEMITYACISPHTSCT